MRNACIALKKKVNASDDGINAVLDVFSANGYPCEELRILLQSDEKKASEALKSLKKETENILFIADKTALPIARRYLAEIYKDNFLQGELGCAGIFGDERSSLFLLSADRTETGVAFAKNVCIPFLQKKYGVRFDKIVIRTMGANEARVEALINEAQNFAKNAIACTRIRKYDEEIIELAYDSSTPKMLIDDVLRLFVEGLGDSVYALDDTSLDQQVINLLKLRRRKISVAESFTGGGIARRLTSVSGASEVYFEGLNTYNELSKIKRLGVSEYTLRSFGAVSDQTAYEMAAGLLGTGNCDIAVATTGLAGPNTDRSMLPVGLCFIAVGVKERIFVYRYKFDGTREEITEKAINYALFLAYKQLKNL